MSEISLFQKKEGEQKQKWSKTKHNFYFFIFFLLRGAGGEGFRGGS